MNADDVKSIPMMDPLANWHTGGSSASRRTIYVDLDGVMADFDAAFPALFGLDHRLLADDEMWGTSTTTRRSSATYRRCTVQWSSSTASTT